MEIPIPDSIKNRIDLSKINFAEIKKTGIDKANQIIALAKQADRKTLIQSLGGVLGLYVLIFLYVYVNAASTVKTLEDSMASQTVELEKPSFGRPKIDQKYYADANLVDGLSKYEDIGRLPVIRANDKLTSFRAYQIPYVFDGYEKRIVTSFMIKDFGLSEKNSKIALEILPPEVSFLLSPYASQPMAWIKRARKKGHEVWLDLPVQSEKYPDSGLNTIFHHHNLNEKYDSMHESMMRGLGYVGVGMFLDETIKPVEEHYKQLSDELHGRGLGIFEKNPDAPSLIEARSFARGAPFIRADIEVFQMKGKNSFTAMETIANKKGHAVAVIPPYPKALKNLAIWIEKVGRGEFVVVPVSAIYDLPMAQNSPKQKNSPSGLSPSDHAAQPIKHH